MDPADRKRDFISLAILAVVAISQIWLVSHPIKVLEKEMRHFGKGDFSEAETPVQLAEYNQLLQRSIR